MILNKHIRNWKYILLFAFNILFLCYQLFCSRSSLIGSQSRHPISRSHSILFDNKELKLSLDSLFKRQSDNIVVLRMLKNDCAECRDSIFNNTIRLVNSFGKNNVFVLFNGDYNYDEYIAFKRIYQYDVDNLYYVRDIITDLDSLGNSYYFYNSVSDPSIAQSTYEIKAFRDVGYSLHYKQWLMKVKNVIGM